MIISKIVVHEGHVFDIYFNFPGMPPKMGAELAKENG